MNPTASDKKPAARRFKSCLECQSTKKKCSREDVCSRCARLGKECVYHNNNNNTPSNGQDGLKRSPSGTSAGSRSPQRYSPTRYQRNSPQSPYEHLKTQQGPPHMPVVVLGSSGGPVLPNHLSILADSALSQHPKMFLKGTIGSTRQNPDVPKAGYIPPPSNGEQRDLPSPLSDVDPKTRMGISFLVD
ncbi:hypothetical protein BDR26DRAFT_870437 [Obelidium mucronatum]|nr:hypothetical protein BDR26DRAFT_870437 [Obelidium mucronatum]